MNKKLDEEIVTKSLEYVTRMMLNLFGTWR